jgi:hypothetical protein
VTSKAQDYAAKAASLWDTFDDNARAGIAFGIFPAEAMDAAEREGYLTQPLAIALMRHARSRKVRQP